MYKWKRDGAGDSDGQAMERVVDYSNPSYLAQNRRLESKKAKRSITLSKWSHLKVIRVDWQCDVDPLSIADFDPNRASIA